MYLWKGVLNWATERASASINKSGCAAKEALSPSLAVQLSSLCLPSPAPLSRPLHQWLGGVCSAGTPSSQRHLGTSSVMEGGYAAPLPHVGLGGP